MTDELQAAEAEAAWQGFLADHRDADIWLEGDVELRDVFMAAFDAGRATEAARSRGEKKEITEEMVDRALEGWFHGLGGDWREVAPLPQTQADLRSRARAALSAALAVITEPHEVNSNLG